MKRRIVVAVLCFCLVTPLITSTTGNDNERPPDWSENFDTYSNGQILDGTPDDGGWKGWENNTAYGATVTDTMYHSSPHSVDINTDSDLVHEFSGYTNGTWVFTAWQYIPNDFTGESAFILLDIYSDDGANNNWATQINFNSSTNQVISEFEDVTLPLIKGQWVELRNVINLDNDTQYFYYDGTLLTNKSWTEGVSGGGILDIGAVDLFANGASTIYYDDISLVPFTNASTISLNLYEDWNMITAPLDNGWTAETLGQNITGCTTVSMFNGSTQTFTTHVVGSPHDDFAILDGMGYFIYLTQDSYLNMTSLPIASVSVPIYTGWDLIGWYHDDATTADSLGCNITDCSIVSMFNGSTQTFLSHVPGSPHDDFPVTPGMGLFIYASSDSTWTGEG